MVAAEADGLAALGHEVAVLAAAKPVRVGDRAAAVPEDAASPVRIVRIFPHNFYFYAEGEGKPLPLRFAWHLADMFNRRAAADIAAVVQAAKPDVVHTHNLMGLGFSVPARLRRFGLRHVHTVHDVQLLHPSGLLADADRLGFAARAYVAIMRRLMGSPDVVIFPSKFLFDLHEKRGFFPGSRKIILPTPAPEAALRARAFPHFAGFAFVGQLERHKGILDLLDVWDSWQDRGSAELAIAGDGSLAAEVRERAARTRGVAVLGKLDREGVQSLLDRSAFLVAPSNVIENAPAIIMESLSRGTPVIASAIGGIPEFVADGLNGFLFRAGDRTALLAALRRAQAALPEWQKFFEVSCKSVKDLGLETHLERLLAEYK